MSTTRFIFLFAAFCLVVGCSYSAPKPTPDPLAGYHFSSLKNLDANKAITDDYKDYIKKLSPDEKGNAIPIIEFFEDGTGLHAVRITIGMHTDWEHVLIYDKDDKRIKTIKYISGHSYS